MKNRNASIITLLILSTMISTSVYGETWTFIKEKDGVKLYSSQIANKGLKIFKGITEISASADKVFLFLEDLNHTEWWTKEVTQLKVLHYEKNRNSSCYFVYELPWPFKNRDLCVNITSTINTSTGVRKLKALPLKGVVAEHKELVRIKDYRQEWTVKSLAKNKTQLELEYYIDPQSDLPDWLINMVLDEAPINVINEVRKHMK